MIPLAIAAKKVTKKALLEYFSAMLWRCEVNHGIWPATSAAPDEFDLDIFRTHPRSERTFSPTIFGADEAALHWLIQQHPEYEEKRGCGIAGFTVVSTIFGARGFAIVRADGSCTDFSYRECISPKSLRTEVLAALRHEVADDIQDAKLRYFAQHGDQFCCVACPKTKNTISIGQSHADHQPPWTFQILAEAFLGARDIVISEDLLEPSTDNQHVRRLADRALAAAWRSFHHDKAIIWIVDSSQHRARSEDRPCSKGPHLILNRE
jgi:hypothetical protein